MNACHDCEPTHNTDVRAGGRCWCPCHSPAPREATTPAIEHGDRTCTYCGALPGQPCTSMQGWPGERPNGRPMARSHHHREHGPAELFVRTTVIVNSTDPEELAAVLRRLAVRLDREPQWPPHDPPWALLDTNGNTCGTMLAEVLQ